MPPRKSTTKPSSTKYNYKIIDVSPDGNCFFRAIYKSTKDSGNLEKFTQCFLSKSYEHYNTHERDFILDLREKLAKSIEEENDGGVIEGMFGYLNSFHTADKKHDLMESYKEVINSLPAWMSVEFSSPPKDIAKFRAAFCKNIRKQGTYVSQIEIDIFKYLNDTFCNTPEKHTVLNMFMSSPPRDINLSQINIINVANIHYKYLANALSVKSASSSFSSTTASSSSPASASTTLSTIKSSDSSDTKLSKSIQKQLRDKQSSPTSSSTSTSDSSNASSLSSETKELMADFKKFVLKSKNKSGGKTKK
jgi:hypothetical protein